MGITKNLHTFRGGIASRNINESYDISGHSISRYFKGKIVKSDFYRFFLWFFLWISNKIQAFSPHPPAKISSTSVRVCRAAKASLMASNSSTWSFFGGHHHGTLRESWIIWLDIFTHTYYVYICVCVSICLSVCLI